MSRSAPSANDVSVLLTSSRCWCKRLLDFAPHTAQFPEFPRAAEEIHPEVAVRVQDDLQIRAVGDRGRPGRFDEVDHFRCDSHVDVMPTAHQFTTDSDVRLDFAPRPPVCQYKFHRGS